MDSRLSARVAERIDETSTRLSALLAQAYGGGVLEEVRRALTQPGCAPPTLPARLTDGAVALDQRLDVLCTQALFTDCLTLVTLTCARAATPFAPTALEPLRPFLTRLAGFLAAVEPAYQAFRTLPVERIVGLLNTFAADDGWLGLLSLTVRFPGLQLIGRTAERSDANLVAAYLTGVLVPIRDALPSCLGVTAAAPLWREVTARAAACRRTGS